MFTKLIVRSSFGLFLLCLSPLLLLAQQREEVNVFGPETFTRTKGPPNVFAHNFMVAAGIEAPFTLKIQNGNPDGTQRISAASIVLNGVEVVQENEFNQQVGNIEKNIPLTQSNHLEARLRGAPGGFLMLTITGFTSRAVGGIPGDPNAFVNGNLPNIPFPMPSAADFTRDSDTGLLTARTRIMLLFRNGVTIGQANTTLQSINASVIGTIPSINLLLIEIPDTGDLTGVKNALTTLQADPHVAVAVQDTEIGFSIIPAPSDITPNDIDPNSAGQPGLDTWEWPPQSGEVPMLQLGGGMLPAPAQDGNWGLEACRAPQMWNLNDFIGKQGRMTQTGVLDVGFQNGFQNHIDLGNLFIAPGSNVDDHGSHVSGIIGATFDNRVDNQARGVDGMNPFAAMTGVDALGQPPTIPSIGSSIINALVNMLTNFPQLRVVNISLGYNWGPNTGGAINPNTNVNAQRVVIGHGLIMRLIAATHPNVLLVPAAGNDSSGVFGYPTEIHAKWGSPMNWAALEGPIIILPLGPLPAPPPPLPPIVNQPSLPTAKARASVISGSPPLDVQFFGEGFDPDGGNVSFAWDFDGDGVIDSGDQNPSFTYSTPGKQTAILTVEDEEGETATASLTVEVSANDPAVQIALPPSTLNSFTVQFEAEAFDPDGGSLSFHWDFGDGSIATVQSPVHLYSQPGTFVVTLAVTDDEGNSSVAMITIVALIGFIILPPAPNIIVVEAIQNSLDTGPGCAVANNFCKTDFSNVGGHISAPGGRILSTVLNNLYARFSGTSMAAPQVTGLNGYLLAFDPTLTFPEIRSRLSVNSHPVGLVGGENLLLPAPPNDVQPNAFPPGVFRVALPPPVLGPAQRIDAFAATVGIDAIRPGDPVQRALVDTDDGTIDGNDHTVAADIRGDGRVSMRDFRRFRDAYLITKAEAFPEFVGEIAFSLRDPPNVKNDLNRDGCVQELGSDIPTCTSDENVYPRFDFNGDGVLDDRRALLKGVNLMDIEVLAAINLWSIFDREDEVRLNEEVSVDPADELASDINPHQDIIHPFTTAHWLLADRDPDADGRIDYLYSCDLEFRVSFAASRTNALEITILSGPSWAKHFGYDSTFLAPIAPADPSPLPGAGIDQFVITVPLYEQLPTQAEMINGHLRPPGAPQSASLSIRGLVIAGPPFAIVETTLDIQQEVCTQYGEDVLIQINVP